MFPQVGLLLYSHERKENIVINNEDVLIMLVAPVRRVNLRSFPSLLTCHGLKKSCPPTPVREPNAAGKCPELMDGMILHVRRVPSFFFPRPVRRFAFARPTRVNEVRSTYYRVALIESACVCVCVCVCGKQFV